MPWFWQGKPAQYCHLFEKLEGVIFSFESTYETLSIICFFLNGTFFCLKWRVLLCNIGSWVCRQVGDFIYPILINWTALSSWKSVTLCLTLTSLFWVAKGLLFDFCLWMLQSQRLGLHVEWQLMVQNPGSSVRNVFLQLCHMDLWIFSFIVS